jgi:hypothetical protein
MCSIEPEPMATLMGITVGGVTEWWVECSGV